MQKRAPLSFARMIHRILGRRRGRSMVHRTGWRSDGREADRGKVRTAGEMSSSGCGRTECCDGSGGAQMTGARNAVASVRFCGTRMGRRELVVWLAESVRKGSYGPGPLWRGEEAESGAEDGGSAYIPFGKRMRTTLHHQGAPNCAQDGTSFAQDSLSSSTIIADCHAPRRGGRPTGWCERLSHGC